MTQAPDFAGLVLAGGRGERLGGRDKGLIPLRGEPFARHLVRVLRSRLETVIISANRAREQYEGMADAVLSDQCFPQQGPLAGLFEGLVWARERGFAGVLVTSCDTPNLSTQWVARLVDAAQAAPGVAYLSRLDERVQPLHGYYPVGALTSIEQFLNEGERRVRRLAAELSPVWIDCQDLSEDFVNVNEPGDLDRLRGR